MIGPSIILKDVSLTLNGNCILAPINTELAAGQLHLLIGPNGAGKTSLLKTMLGLQPHRGEIMRRWPDKKSAANKLAYIPQQPLFDAVLPVTVADYLMATISKRPLFFKQSSTAHERVDVLLQQVGMGDKQQLQLGELSGGERQRLMFAQALHWDSPLWFMDEPMSGLDGEGQEIIIALINRLRAEGRTLVMVHHDMDYVRRYADNLLLIDGALKATGSAEQVLGSINLTAEVA